MRFSFTVARERATLGLLRWFPKGTYGRTVGFLARRRLPRRLRARLYTGFAQRYGVDLSVIERELTDYASFSEFFARRLRAGARPVEPDPEVVVSPVDGVVVESGVVMGGRLLQAKGIDYTLRGLLVDESAAALFDGGTYVTLYLAPGDYHRIHTPVAGSVTGYRHIPGAFFPVNGPSVRNVPGLFARNERLVTYLDSSFGPVAVVKVAATGVGNISVAYDDKVRTRMHTRRGIQRYGETKQIGKGDELGTFHLGSTVIVLFQRGRITLPEGLTGRKLLQGQAMAKRAARAADDAAA